MSAYTGLLNDSWSSCAARPGMLHFDLKIVDGTNAGLVVRSKKQARKSLSSAKMLYAGRIWPLAAPTTLGALRGLQTFPAKKQ